MASKVVSKAAGGVVEISKKHTLQSTGIWERIRRTLSIDPNRSNGVPLNPYFRNPPPGTNDPLSYTDPVTLPAGDIAGNPYWKRDARRAYPRLSTVNQSDAVALLSVGSAAKPTAELVGEAGAAQLVAVKEEGEEKGLAKFFEEKGLAAAAGESVFVDGLPPLPSGQSMAKGSWAVHDYQLTEQSYGEQYPCRSFK